MSTNGNHGFHDRNPEEVLHPAIPTPAESKNAESHPNRKVERCRKELETAVDLKEATDTTVEDFLARLATFQLEERICAKTLSYRSASEDLIFRDYAESCSLSTERYLWNWHTRVNNRFRKSLKRFQEGDGKKKVVERRKSEKQYIGFIKSSQAFYRGFIQRLASHFADVEEVVEVACKLASSRKFTK